MQLHELQPNTKRRAGKRVGRGGKRGTTAGRGTKGQKARAGHRIRPEIRDVIKRLPKLRGHDFRLGRSTPRVVVPLSRLLTLKERVITPFVLRRAGLIPSAARLRVKILADHSEVKIPIRLKGCDVSTAVRAMVEKAGGKIQV